MLARSLIVYCGEAAAEWTSFEKYFNLPRTYSRMDQGSRIGENKGNVITFKHFTHRHVNA